MQYSVHPPTPFIQRHWEKLLPEWSCGVDSVLIALQHSTCNLVERTDWTESEKNSLRHIFLHWSQTIALQLHQMGYFADPFDPKTGYPIFTKPGLWELDDVAVIHRCLGYPKIQVNECSIIWHPNWGSAVYPAVLLSSASPDVLRGVVNAVGTGGGLESNSQQGLRSAYHHSSTGRGSFIQ